MNRRLVRLRGKWVNLVGDAGSPVHGLGWGCRLQPPSGRSSPPLLRGVLLWLCLALLRSQESSSSSSCRRLAAVLDDIENAQVSINFTTITSILIHAATSCLPSSPECQRDYLSHSEQAVPAWHRALRSHAAPHSRCATRPPCSRPFLSHADIALRAEAEFVPLAPYSASAPLSGARLAGMWAP